MDWLTYIEQKHLPVSCGVDMENQTQMIKFPLTEKEVPVAWF